MCYLLQNLSEFDFFSSIFKMRSKLWEISFFFIQVLCLCASNILVLIVIFILETNSDIGNNIVFKSDFYGCSTVYIFTKQFQRKGALLFYTYSISPGTNPNIYIVLFIIIHLLKKI